MSIEIRERMDVYRMARRVLKADKGQTEVWTDGVKVSLGAEGQL